jgi:hypothetical protein
MLGPPKRPLSHDMLHRLHRSSYAYNARAPSLSQEPLTYEAVNKPSIFFFSFLIFLCVMRLKVPKLVFSLDFSGPFFRAFRGLSCTKSMHPL